LDRLGLTFLSCRIVRSVSIHIEDIIFSAVPLIVHIPKNVAKSGNYRPGTVNDEVISLIDITLITMLIPLARTLKAQAPGSIMFVGVVPGLIENGSYF